MSDWLSKVKNALAGDGAAKSDARAHLLVAHRDRAILELESLNQEGIDIPVMSATIEQIREKDLMISQPSVGGINRVLATGERLRLSFVGLNGRLRGESTVLGRIKVPAGGASEENSGGRMLYGYRLALPASLEIVTERTDTRALIGRDLAVEVELHTFEQQAPIRGFVKDISKGGLKIRSSNAKGKLSEGQRLYLKVELPPPVGLLTEMVRITHLEPTGKGEQLMIGLAFGRRIEVLTKFLKDNARMQKATRRTG